MNQRRLFLGCFVSMIATALVFAVRGAVLNDWGVEFGLTEELKGMISGAGLYPFAITIILFSLIQDKIGYGRSMAIAFLLQIAGAIVTIAATPPHWEMLYIGTFIYALGNGVVEAVINPVVATLYGKNKTQWLNVLHAGWPAGLVLGGLLSIAVILGGDSIKKLSGQDPAAGNAKVAAEPPSVISYSFFRNQLAAGNIAHATVVEHRVDGDFKVAPQNPEDVAEGEPARKTESEKKYHLRFSVTLPAVALIDQKKLNQELADASSNGPTGQPGWRLWQYQMAITFVPVLIYGFLLLGQTFPVQERVAAGVSYMDMLKEFGWASSYICFFLLTIAVNAILLVAHVEPASIWVQAAIAVVPTVLFGIYVRSFGRPMFVFLMLVMFLLATTELGTDSWISAIMQSVLASPIKGTLFLVYTSTIMFFLRFYAGPIVHKLSPLGLLAVCSAIACGGLYWLSAAGSSAGMLFLAATFYGCGKSFFWPTTLGIVSEQYPRGGALTLNAIAGAGVLAVGLIGAPLIGTVQDHKFVVDINAANKTLAEEVTTEKEGLFGMKSLALDSEKYNKTFAPLKGVDVSKPETLSASLQELLKEKKTVDDLSVAAKQALAGQDRHFASRDVSLLFDSVGLLPNERGLSG